MRTLVVSAVESSTAVDEAANYHGLCRILFRACLEGFSDTIAPVSCGRAPICDLERGGWELLPPCGCEMRQDRRQQFGEKLKGRLLKGSFDKRVRIDLPVPLSVPTRPRTLPTPFPFSLIFHRKPSPTTNLNPTPNPSSRDTKRNLASYHGLGSRGCSIQPVEGATEKVRCQNPGPLSRSLRNDKFISRQLKNCAF